VLSPEIDKVVQRFDKQCLVDSLDKRGQIRQTEGAEKWASPASPFFVAPLPNKKQNIAFTRSVFTAIVLGRGLE
jgi:hypothetical protein